MIAQAHIAGYEVLNSSVKQILSDEYGFSAESIDDWREIEFTNKKKCSSAWTNDRYLVILGNSYEVTAEMLERNGVCINTGEASPDLFLDFAFKQQAIVFEVLNEDRLARWIKK